MELFRFVLQREGREGDEKGEPAAAAAQEEEERE